MAAGELQRIAKSERKAKAVHQTEAERHHPAPSQVDPQRIFDGDVHDRERDQHADAHRKPWSRRHESQARQREREGVRHRKRRHGRHEIADAAIGQREDDEKQKMIEAVEKAKKAVGHKYPHGLNPTGIQMHDAGLVDQ